MDWEDLKPKKPPEIVLGEDLSRLSLGELATRIAALQAEVARVEAEITRKKAIEAAAKSVFKS